MEIDLINKITLTLEDFPGSHILPEEEARRLITVIAAKYSWDLTSFSPWEKQEGILYPYNDPSEWGLLLSSMLGIFTGDVYLVVMNGSPFPWPVIALSVDDIQPLLLELPHFEFFIFDDAMEGVVVDTHYNELIVLEK